MHVAVSQSAVQQGFAETAETALNVSLGVGAAPSAHEGAEVDHC